MAQEERKQHKVMTKPLPVILDEMDAAIAAANAATLAANQAAIGAKEAGVEAGEKARLIATGAVEKVARDLADAEAKLRQQILEAQSSMLEEIKRIGDIANLALNEHRVFRAAIIRGLNFTGEEINKSDEQR